MSLTGIIVAVIGGIGAVVAAYFRYRRNQQSERDQNLGRLQQRDRQRDKDREALVRAKKVKDEVEALDNPALLDRLRRFVRR